MSWVDPEDEVWRRENKRRLRPKRISFVKSMWVTIAIGIILTLVV